MIRQPLRLTLVSLWVAGLGACNQPSSEPGPVPRPATSDPIPSGAAPSGPLPANHPPVGGGSATAPGMPPGHPGVAPGAAPPSGPAPQGPATAGGLTWTAGDPFQREVPRSSMRKAQYRVPAPHGGPAAQLAVFYFGPGQGGSVQDNLDRWIGQIDPPGDTSPADAATVTKEEAHGLPLSIVTSVGTFAGLDGMPHEDWRLLGAIAEGPEGPVFFKLTGPRDLVDAAEPGFRELVASIRPE